MRRPPVVAIVGIPNVGKSTLFNRLVGRRKALVDRRPGVTRDRIRGEARLGERAVTLVDTGGIFADAGEGMAGQVHSQAQVAVAEADAILLVVSARDGLTPADRGVARLVRKSGRPTVLVVNKVDDGDADSLMGEFHALGMGEPTPISAEHGLGIGTLVERVLAELPETVPEETAEEETRALAIVGRPNVGKSSLLNALAREERAIVSEVPGTTRDSIDLLLEAGGLRYRIIDTAGIRRVARAPDPIDRLSMQRATESLQAADVTLLLISGDEIANRDLSVGGLAKRFCRPLVIGVNKWDLAPRGEAARSEFRKRVASRFKFARFAPVLFLSARTGLGLSRLFPAVESVWKNGAIQVGAGRLNRLLQRLHMAQRPRTRAGRPMKCFYIAQTGIHPPAFTIFVNTSEAPHFAYRRFLENRIREEFGFHLTPIVLHWKPR